MAKAVNSISGDARVSTMIAINISMQRLKNRCSRLSPKFLFKNKGVSNKLISVAPFTNISEIFGTK